MLLPNAADMLILQPTVWHTIHVFVTATRSLYGKKYIYVKISCFSSFCVCKAAPQVYWIKILSYRLNSGIFFSHVPGFPTRGQQTFAIYRKWRTVSISYCVSWLSCAYDRVEPEFVFLFLFATSETELGSFRSCGFCGLYLKLNAAAIKRARRMNKRRAWMYWTAEETWRHHRLRGQQRW